MRTLLVTGGRGFVGRQVEAACRPDGAFADFRFIAMPAGLDVRDERSVAAMVAKVKPDAIIHLAAQSFVPRSLEAPRETLEVNVLGTLSVLEALRHQESRATLLLVSSGDVYGRVADDALPVTETTPPCPRNPYAVSKIATEELALQYHRTFNIDVRVARPFNHVGPGQSTRFVLPALARQIVDIADGLHPSVIDAGDVDVTRDFTDVRDVVAAYAAILRAGSPGSRYVVASGQERSVRSCMEMMCQLAGVVPALRQRAENLRPAEQRRMVADSERLRRETGWTPTIPFEQTLGEILQEARSSR